jgi:type I restriction enzyme, S subunit
VTDTPTKMTWTKVTLAECCDEIAQRVDNPAKSGFDRFVGLDHLKTGQTSVHNWGSTEDVTSSMKIFKAGDVIVARRNVYLRRASLVDFDGVCSGDGIVLRGHPKTCLPELLPFLLNTDGFWEYVTSQADGTMSKRITVKRLLAYEFALPPLEQQRRIAEVLGSFSKTADSLVLLENQATRTFRVSLSAALMLETKRVPELKTVPAGWEIAKLSELTDPDRPVSYGILKPGDEDPRGVPMLRVQDFDDYGVRSRTTISKVSREIADTSKTTYLEHGDVVVSIMATIGRAMLVTPSMSGWNVNRALAVLPAGPSVEGDFLEAYLQSSFVQRILFISQIGGVQSRINLEFLKSLLVPVPPKEIRMKTVRLRNQLGASLEEIRQRRDVIRSMQNRFLEELSK